MDNLKRQNKLPCTFFELANTLDPIRSLKVACTLKLHVHKSCHSRFFKNFNDFIGKEKLHHQFAIMSDQPAKDTVSDEVIEKINQSWRYFSKILLNIIVIKYHLSIFDICWFVYIFENLYSFQFWLFIWAPLIS